MHIPIGKLSITDEKMEESDKRPAFGNRHLNNESEIFKHNAWDNVPWDEELLQAAQNVVTNQIKSSLDPEKAQELELNADSFWEKFYDKHENRFFKDRKWLSTEFPELLNHHVATNKLNDECNTAYPGSHAQFRILEVGCGVGNTIFPIVEANDSDSVFVYGCDFSSTAIEIVKAHQMYNEKRCHAFVCDITQPQAKMPFPPESLDIIVMIFVLSAINPAKMESVINYLTTFLKPGGLLLFRDYGLYDMAQLRFKPAQCIEQNFYVRGDGTRVYFFQQDEIDKIFTSAGLIKRLNLIDRRLQVNRGKQLKMYRVWIQCRYQKPLNE